MMAPPTSFFFRSGGKQARVQRMSEIPKTDTWFLILHRAGWSIGDTAFMGKGGIT